MQRTRRRLSWLAAGWVLLQLAAFVTAPIVLSAEHQSEAVPVEHCTCPDAVPGRACPMHHGRGQDKESESDCKLRNPCAPSDAALLSLAGAIGLVPSQSAAALDQIAALIPGTLVGVVSRVELPEFPPPRS